MLRETFARGDVVFSFGGVGATPDDHTRQAAAAALGVPLERHPDAVAALEAQFGADAYPHRVLMAEFPAGAADHSEPGQSRRVVLDSRPSLLSGLSADGLAHARLGARDALPARTAPSRGERAIVVYGAGESQLLPLMNDCVARFPQLKLFSLPSFLPEGGRRIELGFRGEPTALDAALAASVGRRRGRRSFAGSLVPAAAGTAPRRRGA